MFLIFVIRRFFIILSFGSYVVQSAKLADNGWRLGAGRGNTKVRAGVNA